MTIMSVFDVRFARRRARRVQSGDITLAPTNVDNSTTTGGGGGGATNPCASYHGRRRDARRAASTAANCTYDATFVSETNPLTVSLTIPFISGVHIFQDSLFVGRT